MQKTPIYFDNNATTALRAAAITAMQGAMGPPANPSSVHGFGRNARLVVETSRNALAMLAGCRAGDVVFTSGGTEANNLVMAQYNHVITSAIEHDSVRHAHQNCHQIAVDEDGVVDLDMLATVMAGIDDAAKPRTLISIMAANNETGVIQPMDEIAAMAELSLIHI